MAAEQLQKRRAQMRENSRRWRARNPGAQYAAVKSWTERNREKRNAQAKVYRAIRAGKLARPGTCETPGCEAPDPHAHHEDYAKPLAVRWLCPVHHYEADQAREGS